MYFVPSDLPGETKLRHFPRMLAAFTERNCDLRFLNPPEICIPYRNLHEPKLESSDLFYKHRYYSFLH